MLVVQLRSALSQRDHTRLYANCLQLRRVELVRTARQFLEVDVASELHLPRVDLKNTCPCRFVWKGKFDFTIQSTRTKKSGVKNVNAICGRDDL